MRRALAIASRLLILALVVGASYGAYAYGGSAVGETTATYSVGGIDLKVDSKAYYNSLPRPQSTWSAKDLQPYYDKFFNIQDVKPGDTGTTTISLHIKKASAWVCLAFKDFKEKENGRNEPEKLADATQNTGELGKGMEFFAWFDDGDNKFEIGEKPLFGTTSQSAIQTLKNKSYPLADAKHGSPWSKDSVHYVGIAWCAGDLGVNLATAKVSCNGNALGNEAQTDSLSFSVALEAVPYTQNKKFECAKSKAGHGRDDEDNDDDDDDDEHHYSWYNYGDDDGYGGACNDGKKS